MSSATKGYWLNQAFNDLRLPESREAFKASIDDYLDRYPLTEKEKQLVRNGDWGGCIQAGASVYTLTKLGATTDVSLLTMGAQMRGESMEEFRVFLTEQNERLARFELLPGSGGGQRG